MTAPKVTPKVGDRVRVVLEGEVTHADYYRDGEFGVGGHHGMNVIYRNAQHVKSVEILPPPVRVGDVATREVLDRLPYGSAIVDTAAHVLQLFPFNGERRWYYAGDSGAYTPETVAKWNATVIFIPDPK